MKKYKGIELPESLLKEMEANDAKIRSIIQKVAKTKRENPDYDISAMLIDRSAIDPFRIIGKDPLKQMMDDMEKLEKFKYCPTDLYICCHPKIDKEKIMSTIDNPKKCGCENQNSIPKMDMRPDPWVHRSLNMMCRTCMWYAEKLSTIAQTVQARKIGRCRKHAPTMNGYPVVYNDDWCGDHKLDENKINDS